MRKPQSPPSLQTLSAEAVASGRIQEIIRLEVGVVDAKGRYLHWDKLRRLEPPHGLTHNEWWLGLKLQRMALRTAIPLLGTDGRQFSFALPDPVPERLHQIDLGAGGSIGMPEQVTSSDTRDRYIVNSLIEEAITSSQIEGAVTTREIAKDMIRTGRPPRDRSEQMILNNYRTMRFIRTLKDKALTPELVSTIQQNVTDETLDDPTAAGRRRREDEPVDVADECGEVFHTPPPPAELEYRMQVMCDFANGKTPEAFVHPVIRSIILHFWLAYDHPYKDGNGRAARALFYWSMLRHGYWLCEFISISHIIRSSAAKYYRSFLYTETDDNDLTYFLLYHLQVIHKAIEQLHVYIRTKATETQSLQEELRGIQFLNHRQRTLIGHALRHSGHHYTIKSHQSSHDVVYETARSDLHDLVERGLLASKKSGKTWVFVPVNDLDEKLRQLNA